jgi:hypothetical protein
MKKIKITEIHTKSAITDRDCYRIPYVSGKIRTTTFENIELQKLFLKNGFSFLDGSKEVKERDNLDYFYFEKNIISLGSKEDMYNNRNPFNLKYFDGETNFRNKKLKERDVTVFLGSDNNPR